MYRGTPGTPFPPLSQLDCVSGEGVVQSKPKVFIWLYPSLVYCWWKIQSRFLYEVFQMRWLAPSPCASCGFSGKIQGTVVWLLALIFHRLTTNTYELWDGPLKNITWTSSGESSHCAHFWTVHHSRCTFLTSPSSVCLGVFCLFSTCRLWVQCFWVLALALLPAIFLGYHPFFHGSLWVFPHRQKAFSHGHNELSEVNIKNAMLQAANTLAIWIWCTFLDETMSLVDPSASSAGILGCPAFCPLPWCAVALIISNSDKIYRLSKHSVSSCCPEWLKTQIRMLVNKHWLWSQI